MARCPCVPGCIYVGLLVPKYGKNSCNMVECVQFPYVEVCPYILRDVFRCLNVSCAWMCPCVAQFVHVCLNLSICALICQCVAGCVHVWFYMSLSGWMCSWVDYYVHVWLMYGCHKCYVSSVGPITFLTLFGRDPVRQLELTGWVPCFYPHLLFGTTPMQSVDPTTRKV